MTISAITITKNEERNIERCIKSCKGLVDEHIVVDSDSTDKTKIVAERTGAKVFTHPWRGYGPQKNFGLSQAQGEWVLFIDADEEVSPELASQIKKVTNTTTSPNFYWLRIVTVFLGTPLRHLYGHNPRLFKKSAGHWSNEAVHEQVETLDGQKIQLGDKHSKVITEPLLHHSHPTIESYLKKMHRYTTLDADQMRSTGKHRSGRPVKASAWLPYRLAIRQFIKLVFYRGGWHDGCAGIAWCVLSAYYEYEMARKYLGSVHSD